MPFILGIQTPWQKEMMIEHGHQGGVAVDATFGERSHTYYWGTLAASALVIIFLETLEVPKI
jgi:hypothetical protein